MFAVLSDCCCCCFDFPSSPIGSDLFFLTFPVSQQFHSIPIVIRLYNITSRISLSFPHPLPWFPNTFSIQFCPKSAWQPASQPAHCIVIVYNNWQNTHITEKWCEMIHTRWIATEESKREWWGKAEEEEEEEEDQQQCANLWIGCTHTHTVTIELRTDPIRRQQQQAAAGRNPFPLIPQFYSTTKN